METKFSKSQAVKFYRNSIDKQDATTVAGVIEKLTKESTEKQSYVIEYEKGWLPNEIRAKLYGLDLAKKYLFVSEEELTAIA